MALFHISFKLVLCTCYICALLYVFMYTIPWDSDILYDHGALLAEKTQCFWWIIRLFSLSFQRRMSLSHLRKCLHKHVLFVPLNYLLIDYIIHFFFPTSVVLIASAQVFIHIYIICTLKWFNDWFNFFFFPTSVALIAFARMFTYTYTICTFEWFTASLINSFIGLFVDLFICLPYSICTRVYIHRCIQMLILRLGA